MLVETFVIGSLAGYAKTVYLKSKQLELEDEVKDKILSEGLYHITSKENAENIVKSGYFIPTKGVLKNHFSKSRYGDNFANLVYMFAGKPTKEIFQNNMGLSTFKDGTIYAVKHTPDVYELNNYTQRLEDSSVTYEGRLDITNSKPELVRFMMRNGELVQIPWNEKVDAKLSNKTLIGKLKMISAAYKELGKNIIFKDTKGLLRKSIEKRKEEQLVISQYNNEINDIDFLKQTLDGKEYKISSIGTKKNDGKVLTGFRVNDLKNDEFQKNVFMDGIELKNVTEEQLGDFIIENMDSENIKSDYIGKMIVEDNRIRVLKDNEYEHHFNQKQIMTSKNNKDYESYIEQQRQKKIFQIKKFREFFKEVQPSKRKKVIDIIKEITKSKNRSKNKSKSEIDQEHTL